MKVGFIGLGNVGGKLAGSLLRNGIDLTVRDLDRNAAEPLLAKGAAWAESPKALAEATDIAITCLPSPAAVSEVMESADGIIAGLAPGKVWMEMSTTDEAEVKRLGARVENTGAMPLESPVSGGCHRAATGNIAIFAGGERAAFDKALPILTIMGRRILHVGPLGSGSILKVMTNYLASTHLVALGEALMVMKKAGLDLNTVFEGIRISSGNSFVNETEGQVILNGSYNINFTMDLVIKDVGLFDSLARKLDVPLEISPVVLDIFKDGSERYGARAWSSSIVKCLEDACCCDLRATGFPEELVGEEPEVPGAEVVAGDCARPVG